MDANPPFTVSGQRQVAVILFTDAVSFSARVHEQEVPTLHRLERDMEFMRGAVETHAGVVIKHTGDGLLVQFASAVQAVACALAIQRGFDARTEEANAPRLLRHRVGIHLGDVFVGEGDVMGDGVNIAARLMSEALPGGIMISRTVYDVVKNKLPLSVMHLGPRQLKNIKEPIDVIRVLPQAPQAPASDAAATTTTSARHETAASASTGSRRPTVVVLALLAIALAGWGLWRAQTSHEEDLAESQSAQARLNALLQKQKKTRPKTPADVATRTNFAALVSSTPAATDPHDAQIIAEAREAERRLTAWLMEKLATYSRERPLAVRGLGDPAFQGATIYLDRDGALFFAEGGASRRRDWTELSPAAHAAIIAAVMRDLPQKPPREIVHAIEAFAFLHGRPELLR